MKNLAGVEASDEILEELGKAHISAVHHPHLVKNSEVVTNITGALGPFTFVRNWYYWVACGPVPASVADILYEVEEGKAIRVGGHAAGPDRTYYGETFIHKSRKVIYVDSRRGDWPDYLKETMTSLEESSITVGTKEEAREAAKYTYVGLYHIDTQEGLNTFADTLRDHHQEVDEVASFLCPWYRAGTGW